MTAVTTAVVTTTFSVIIFIIFLSSSLSPSLPFSSFLRLRFSSPPLFPSLYFFFQRSRQNVQSAFVIIASIAAFAVRLVVVTKRLSG